jgi:hypothetical protein
MDRVVQIFDGPVGFARANAADHAYYDSLSPQQRLDLAVVLQERYRAGLGEAGQRLERVARVLPLGGR